MRTNLNIHGIVVEINTDNSPFLQTLVTTENMVDKDEDGIVRFDVFPLADMLVYVDYCKTGRMIFNISHVMEYLMYDSCPVHTSADDGYICALYEDLWHSERGLLPKPDVSVVRQDMFGMLMGKVEYIVIKQERGLPTSVVSAILCYKPKYSGNITHVSELEDILSSSRYCVTCSDDGTLIYHMLDGMGLYNKIPEKKARVQEEKTIIKFQYGSSCPSKVLYSLPDKLGHMIYQGKIYRTSKFKHHILPSGME
jgi:hypothetical protein